MNTDKTDTGPFTTTSAVLAGHMLSVRAITKELLALSLAATLAAQEGKVAEIRTQVLSGMPGKEATILTVNYAPSGSSAEHRHDAYVFVYVLEGFVVMQVKGGKEMTWGPGETFYESPEDVHTVSRNASKTKSAKFVVFFVKVIGAPLTVPAN